MMNGPREVLLLLDVKKEARRFLEQGVREHPGFADYQNRLGLLELEEGHAEVALSFFQEAVRLNPQYEAASMNLRLAQRLAGRSSEIKPSKPMRHGSDTWVIQRLEEVWLAQRRGETERTLSLLNELQLSERYRTLGLIYGAQALVRAGRWTEAAERLDEARKESPAAKAVLAFWNFINPLGDESKGKLTQFADLVFWFPTFSNLYDELGGIFSRNGLVQKARREYYRSFLVWPIESHYHLKMADLAIALNREEETISHLSRAIECEPTNVKGRIALGFEYSFQGFVEEAIVQFEVAAKLEPDFPDVRYNLGILYMNQGRSEEAVHHLEKAVELNPGYAPARSTLAIAKKRLGCQDEALHHYRELLSTGMESPDVLAHAAEAYLQRGDAEQARELLEKACRNWPNYPRTYHLLGRLYRRKGLRRKAQWAWRRFLEVSGEWEPLERDTSEVAVSAGSRK
jgi:tetratricopeptide (TPR) repeat protein